MSVGRNYFIAIALCNVFVICSMVTLMLSAKNPTQLKQLLFEGQARREVKTITRAKHHSPFPDVPTGKTEVEALEHKLTKPNTTSTTIPRQGAGDVPNNTEMIRCGRDHNRVIPKGLYLLAPEIFDEVPTSFLPKYKNPCWRGRWDALSCLPYFFVIGVSKCGTSDIWSKVSLHPQIAPTTKECHFWRDRPAGLTRFLGYVDRGKELVRRIQTGKASHVYGDGSSTTFYDHYSIYRDNQELLQQGMPYTNADILHALLPKAKFILTVREPVERAYSDYLYRPIGIDLHDKQSPSIFHQLTIAYIQQFKACKENLSDNACLYWRASPTDRSFSLKVGLYSAFLRHWLEVYPREQFFITTMDEWRQNCTFMLKKMFNFLELDKVPDNSLASMCAGRAKNSNKVALHKTGEILPETKQILHDFYRPYNEEMGRIMNDSKYSWL